MSEIVIRPPSPDKPGYFRRFKQLAEIQQRLNTGDPRAIDEAVQLVLDQCEVIVPDGVDPAEVLLDLSRDEMTAALSAVIGGEGVDPQSDD